MEATEKLCAAAFRGDLPMVSDLLHTFEDKEQKNGVNSRGQTPVYCAARQGHEEIVKLLLNEGVDANKQDNHGSTPLHAASFWEHIKVLSMLLTYGCNTEIKNHATGENKGLTAFQEARGKSRMVWQLFNTGGSKALAKAGYPVFQKVKKENDFAATFVKARSSLSNSPIMGNKKKKDKDTMIAVRTTTTTLATSKSAPASTETFDDLFSEIPLLRISQEDSQNDEGDSSDFEFTEWDDKTTTTSVPIFTSSTPSLLSSFSSKKILRSKESKLSLSTTPYSDPVSGTDILTYKISFGNDNFEVLYPKEEIVEHFREYLYYYPKIKENLATNILGQIRLYSMASLGELELLKKLSQYENLTKGILLKIDNDNTKIPSSK